MLIPDPDLEFFPIPDPGSRGQKGTGSGSATLLRQRPGKVNWIDVQEEVSEWETKVKNLKDELMQLEGQRKGRLGLFVFVAESIFFLLNFTSFLSSILYIF
jgi:tetrahydromethanopterin S-methyltransferase subunit G